MMTHEIAQDHVQATAQIAKPTGFYGKILARGMAIGHRAFYQNSAKALRLTEEDRYLEIGFGSGLFIKRYASHVSRIAGLDHSEDMVALATSINRKLIGAGKAEFRRGDTSSIPWEDTAFSAAAAIETFYFWADPEAALREILRVLAPSGRLVIEMSYNRDDGLDHTKLVRETNLRLYSGEEMKKLLVGAGFSEVAVDYYRALWFPVKGYVVPKGMVVTAAKDGGDR
jgi:ubiquinone/menaquinone biosynthesis C-methylase UbiE